MAERYHHEVILKNSLTGAAPPPWLAPFMGAAPPPWLAQFMHNMQAGLGEVREGLEEVRNHVGIRLDRLDARQENVRIGRLNSRELMNNTGTTTYHAKQKEVRLSVISLSDTRSLQPPPRLPETVLHLLIPSYLWGFLLYRPYHKFPRLGLSLPP
jgi:hypothetical protein